MPSPLPSRCFMRRSAFSYVVLEGLENDRRFDVIVFDCLEAKLPENERAKEKEGTFRINSEVGVGV